MARRALAAVALLALGIAGAASAGLISRGAASPPQARASCPSPTPPTGTSTAVTTVGPDHVTTITPTGPPTTVATGCTTSTAASASTTTSTVSSTTETAPTLTTNGSASTLVITGHGWGHGIGMGQWGAYGYALHGWSYERILGHYYRGTTIAAGPSPTVRVLLLDGKRRVTLDSASSWSVVDGARTKVQLPPGKLVVPASLVVAGHALVTPLTFLPGPAPLAVGKKPYRGKLVVNSTGKRLQLVNAVGLESYVAGVVGGEEPDTWPQAALEAQAVAARSYALAQLSTVVTASTYDLYDDTRSQVYGGISAETAPIEQAVAATARRALYYQGKVATTYFSSSSGGETVSAAEAIGTPIPYLVSVPDPWDSLSPNHDWGPVLMSARAVGKALGLDGPVADLELAAGASKHVARVIASGPDTEVTMSGSHVAGALGLRSSWFEVAWLTLSAPDAPARPGSVVTLTGTVRGLDGVTLQAKPQGGVWQTVGPVTPDGAGAFSLRVTPSVPMRYRLASGTIRGALIAVAA